MDAYISGVGMTKFGKSSEPLESLMAEAALGALKNAGLEEVDAVYTGVMNIEEFVGDSNIGVLLVDTLGLSGIPSTRVETASSTGAGAFQTAFYAVASGHMKNVLVVAGEKMTHLTTARTTKILSEVIDRSERRYGATMPALAAMIAQKYGWQYRLSSSDLEELLSHVAIKNHYNGSLNPFAQFRKRISFEEYVQSPVVSYPLRLYDCAPITDGAAAMVLTAEPTDVKISGLGQATDTLALRHRASLTSFNSTKEAAVKAYGMAQVNPSDIQFAEVHDAFTPFEIIGTEDLGFFPPGKGGNALRDGVTTLMGKLPINPSGGLKSRGHPVGASGLAQLVEIVWQLRGEAGEGRQLKKAEIGLAQSIGGLGNNNLVTILERRDRRKTMVPGWKLRYRPEIRSGKKASDPSLEEGVGILETFTILHNPPEGFRSPLSLGFVKLKKDGRVMVCNPEYRFPEQLKIGQKVYVSAREGLYVFERRSFWSRLKQWLKGG